jgi:hypothetical protein
MQRKTGFIRRWYNSWGIAHETGNATPNDPPQKFFVHRNNQQDKTASLAIGVKISFTAGAPRGVGELPQALDIEVVALPAQTAVRS